VVEEEDIVLPHVIVVFGRIDSALAVDVLIGETGIECTGRDNEAVRKWMRSERRFTAHEALEAGIIDFVVPAQDSGGENGDILGLFRSG